MKIHYKVIMLDEVERSPRGRKPHYIPELLEAIKSIHYGEAILLNKTFGHVPNNDRQRVINTIRKHWDKVRLDKPSIHFTEENIPTVSVRKPV